MSRHEVKHLAHSEVIEMGMMENRGTAVMGTAVIMAGSGAVEKEGEMAGLFVTSGSVEPVDMVNMMDSTVIQEQ